MTYLVVYNLLWVVFESNATLGGLAVCLLATGPTLVGSGLAEDDGLLWVIKICSVHFL
jgi:hypothetical protein